MDYQQAKACSIMPGVEILYFGKDGPEQVETKTSDLYKNTEAITISACLDNNFCFIHGPDKDFPIPFIWYFCEIAIIIDTHLIEHRDFQMFPQVEQYIQKASDIFRVEDQFCTFKMTPEIKQIFKELQQIPLPPTMFHFFMQLKVMEMVLLLSQLNLYSTNVHFYPYAHLPEKNV